MKCLVTGVAGFIGSHLAERLIDEGHEVIGVDRMSPYYDVAAKRRNLAVLLESSSFRFREQDVNTLTGSALEGVEVIYHQSAQPGVRSSWGQDFETYLNDNVMATQRILEISRQLGLQRFVYASSSSVYGEASGMVNENSSTLPISPYGVTKLAGENLCFAYRQSHAVPTVVLRYFTVYGPRQRPDMAFHKFIRAAIKDEPITVYGDGSQKRDFTFINDVIEANLACLQDDCVGLVFNIAGGSCTSLNEVFIKIEDIVGKRLAIRSEPWQKGDVHVTNADISLASEKLHYSPKTNLEKGLRAEMEWMTGVSLEQ